MAQKGGNELYHAHGPRSGREQPPGRGEPRRVGGVARAGGPGVAVAPADMSPLLVLDWSAHFRGRERPAPFCVRARGAERGPLIVPVRLQRVAEPAPKAGKGFLRTASALGPVLTGSRQGPSPGGCGLSRHSRPRRYRGPGRALRGPPPARPLPSVWQGPPRPP